ALAEPEDRGAEERRLSKVERLRAIGVEILIQLRPLLVLGHASPILGVPREPRASVDDLQRPLALLPREQRPQRGVTIDGRLPRLAELLRVERSLDAVVNLVVVHR